MHICSHTAPTTPITNVPLEMQMYPTTLSSYESLYVLNFTPKRTEPATTIASRIRTLLLFFALLCTICCALDLDEENIASKFPCSDEKFSWWFCYCTFSAGEWASRYNKLLTSNIAQKKKTFYNQKTNKKKVWQWNFSFRC